MYFKKVNCLFLTVLLLFSLKINGQISSNNPIGNSIVQYEANPIDLSTGLPNINVPLFNLPTIADGLSIDLSLYYHPSSIASDGANSGNCGRGWNMFIGGAIFGTNANERSGWQINEGENSYYDFSFMGYRGTFYVTKSGSLLKAYIAEKNDNFISIDIDYNATTYVINGFSLYDHLGYKYIFNTVDTDEFTIPTNVGYVNSIENYMFQLSTIKDNNNATLVTFNYKSYGTSKKNHIVENIVTHHGKIAFETTLGSSTLYNSNWKFTKILVSDFNNNFIRRFDFLYDTQLIQVDESDLLQTKILSHKFYYKNGIFIGSEGVDEWGFKNLNNSFCTNLSNVTPNYVTNGVLQKISLPTGGSVIYDFESNTYSFKDAKPLEQEVTANGVQVNPNFYTTLNYKNIHNFQGQNLITSSFTTNSSVNFSVTIPKEYVFKLTGEQYQSIAMDTNGNYGLFYPTFTLRKNGVIVDNQLSVQSFCDNESLGLIKYLGIGDYTLTMNASGSTSGIAAVINYTPKSTVNKWHYGNGIRIKRIGYFDTDIVSQKYYENLNPTIFPSKEISYDYSMVENPFASSGCVYTFDVLESTPTVIYRNVTVTQLGGVGKTVNTLYSPLDYYSITNYDGQEPNFSKPKNIKVYNQTGVLLQEKSFTYNTEIVGNNNTNPRYYLNFHLSSSSPAEIRQKDYLPNLTETVWSFDYDSYRKLTNARTYVNPSGDLILKKYYYHTLNSISSKNRRVVEKIETFRNGDLLNTEKVNYSNSWLGVTEPATHPGTTIFPVYMNVSYLPLTQENAKGTYNSFVTKRFNRYDGYSRLWESQQENGMKTVYIWGYRHTQIVAKIENIAYSTIPQSLILDIVRASNTGTEAQLITAQNNLRNHALLAQAMITTYTYKPLIGVSTITDVKNQTHYFTYDIHNQLKYVKDNDNHILRESEYYYQTQN